MSSMDNKVHISYKWTEPGKGIVRNWLYPILIEHGYDARIDVENCKYMANIPQFEKEIGEAELIILIIQSQYFESEDCLFEATYAIGNNNIEDRLLIVNLDNSRIDGDLYSSIVEKYRIEWQKNLNQRDSLGSPREYYDYPILKYSTIVNNLSRFARLLNDSNTLDFSIISNDNFAEIFNYLEELQSRKQLLE